MDKRYLRYLTRRPPTGPGVIHGIVYCLPGEEPCDETDFRANLWEATDPADDHEYSLPVALIHKAQRRHLHSGAFIWFRNTAKAKVHLIKWRPMTKREKQAYERRVAKLARAFMSVL